MSIRIKTARTPAELDSLFRARHRVFVEEEGYMDPLPGRRMFDRFDTFPQAGNVIAMDGDRVVGGIRIMPQTEMGTPADELFDFRPYLPEGVPFGSASMLCVARDYRKVPGLVFTMMAMGYYWAHVHALTHLTGPANPKMEQLFLGTGYYRVADEVYNEEHKLPVLPLILELKNLNERFQEFLRRQEIEHVPGNFERELGPDGHVVVPRPSRARSSACRLSPRGSEIHRRPWRLSPTPMHGAEQPVRGGAPARRAVSVTRPST